MYLFFSLGMTCFVLALEDTMYELNKQKMSWRMQCMKMRRKTVTSLISNWTPLESFTLTLTPRVGPCHSLLLFSVSLLGTFLLNMDTHKCLSQERLSYAVLTLGRSVLIVFNIWNMLVFHSYITWLILQFCSRYNRFKPILCLVA